MKTLLVKYSSIIILLLIWELLGMKGLINPFLMPRPSILWETAIQAIADRSLFIDALVSTRRVFLGFFMAAVVAIPLGLLMSLSKPLRLSLFTMLNFLRPIPPIAWIPLTILWFGISQMLQIQ